MIRNNLGFPRPGQLSSRIILFLIPTITIILLWGYPAPAVENGPAPSPAPPERSDDPLWNEGLSFWNKREVIENVHRALAVFAELSRKYPGQVEPRLWLCRVAYFLGLAETDEKKRESSLEQSIEYCQQAREIEPENIYAIYWLGSAWSHFKEIDAILPQVQKLARAFPPGREIPVPEGPEWNQVMDHWDRRADPARARRVIELLEKISGERPESFEVWAWLARAYYWLGENAETEDEQETLYFRGYELGLKAVERNPRNPGANYWTAANLGRYAQRGSIIRRVKYSKKMFERIVIVDQEEPHYYFGAIPRYLAFCLANAGALTRKVIAGYGYRPDNTLQTIRMSIALEPNYFGTRIALAELALSLGKPGIAREHLEYVLNTPPESLPLTEPENRLDQKKARKLLEEIP